MAKQQLPVVFSADENYIPHLATAVTSLLENNLEHVSRVFVLTDAAETENFHRFAHDIRSRYGLTPEPLGSDMAQVKTLQATGHVSHATYFRFLIPELIPVEIDHVIYLDCDLVVNGSLQGLVDSVASLRRPSADRPDGYGVGAVRRDHGVHLVQYGFRSDTYFNAGVLLINLTLWRDHGLSKRLIDRATAMHGRLDLWDQDVLNLEFEDAWLELPGRFNETIAEGVTADSVVIHFAGSTKPWMVGNTHPFAHLYRHYRSLTPFFPYRREGLGRFLYRRLVPKIFRDWDKTKRRATRRIMRVVNGARHRLRRG